MPKLRLSTGNDEMYQSKTEKAMDKLSMILAKKKGKDDKEEDMGDCRGGK